MIRKFWFSPDVTLALRHYDETLSLCLNSVTTFMQDQARAHGDTGDLGKFDEAVCCITREAIASLNPHLSSILHVAVNRKKNGELGDVEIRLSPLYHNLIATTPGIIRVH